MLELKKYAIEALETAKEDLRRDGYLIPVAFIVTTNEVLDFNLEFEGEEQKASVYRELVKAARERGGTAIVTVNDARCGDPDYPLDGYYPGKLEIEGATECIYVTISGPAITTWSLTVPYEYRDNQLIFGNTTESFDDELNLLPGWPSTPQIAS